MQDPYNLNKTPGHQSPYPPGYQSTDSDANRAYPSNLPPGYQGGQQQGQQQFPQGGQQQGQQQFQQAQQYQNPGFQSAQPGMQPPPQQDSTKNIGNIGYSVAGVAGVAAVGAAGYAIYNHHQNSHAQSSMPPPQQAYPPGGYPPSAGGYPPSAGYPPQQGYPAPQAYPTPQAYPAAAPMGFAPQPAYPVQAAAPLYGYPTIVAGMAPSAIPVWVRPQMTYAVPYSPMVPFVVPVGIPPHVAQKMMQASQAFRMFDTNYSGSLSKKEWKRALRHMGYFIPKGYAKHLFYSIDRDHSGGISEREFCEWWIYTHPY